MIISVRKRRQIKDPERFEAIHISRPVPTSELESIISINKHITMSKSTLERLSEKAKKLIKTKKVKIEVVSRMGRPLDINFKDILKIIELHKSGYSTRKIEQKTGIAKSTVHYLIKKSKRSKIKYKGNTVFVS